MNTIKLYYDDPYMRAFDAVVMVMVSILFSSVCFVCDKHWDVPCPRRDLLVFVSDGPLFPAAGKVGKRAGETKGFFTSFRAMSIANLTLPATRSRKSSCIVPSKDCLSNSAAAADANAEQRLRFYRRSA